jgi:hypothetical protein
MKSRGLSSSLEEKKNISPLERLKTIRCMDPELTPANWCKVQPCKVIRLGSREIILTQPSSSVFVYLLGMLTIGVALFFLRHTNDEVSRFWWGISMLFWGIGAILAGTSYQAFGYYIKCDGQKTCAWTSWWEVIYLIFQQLSLGALLIAIAFACTSGTLRMGLIGFALICAVGYVVVNIYGAMAPIKTLITFEFMVWYSAPIFVIIVTINIWRYIQFGNTIDLSLIFAWLILLLTMTAYWIYDKFEVTSKLWAKGEGIWFSQNDVLHVGLIIWMIYIATVVTGLVNDFAV